MSEQVTIKKECGNCEWFRKTEETHNSGICQLNPPVYAGKRSVSLSKSVVCFEYPKVLEYDRCSHYTPPQPE